MIRFSATLQDILPTRSSETVHDPMNSSPEVIIPWHTRIRSTLPLTKTTVSSDSPRGGQLPGSRTRVHGDWLSDDEAIGHELADGLTGVRVRDFVDFIRIEPNLTLTAAYHGRCEAFLSAKIDPGR